MHCFEKAGLGKAPFRFVGMIQQDLLYGQAILNRDEYQRTGIATTTKPGGSCDYCGTYILDMFQIESADGRRFKVGSTCVDKTGDKGLIAVVDRKAKAIRKARKQASDQKRISAALKILANPKVEAFLRTQKHPNQFMKDRNLLDYVTFLLAKGGTAGKLKAARILEQAVVDMCQAIPQTETQA